MQSKQPRILGLGLTLGRLSVSLQAATCGLGHASFHATTVGLYIRKAAAFTLFRARFGWWMEAWNYYVR